MALVVTTASTAAGPQITNLNNGVSIDFGDYPICTVVTKHITTRARTVETTTTMDIVSQTAVGSGFVWVFDSANDIGGSPAFRLTITCTVDDTAGVEAAELVADVVMGEGAKPTMVLGAVSLHHRIEVPGAGVAADARVLYPGIVSSIRKWTDSVLLPTVTPVKLAHPGSVRVGGGTSDGFNEADEPNNELSPNVPNIIQYSYWYDHTMLEGLFVRTTDNVGRYKCWTFLRDVSDNSIIVTMTFCPPDNSVGINGLSDLHPDYALQLRPMTGDWNHAIRYQRERMEAEDHPVLHRPPIQDDPGRSPRARNLLCWAPSFFNTADFDFDGYFEQTARIMEYFGLPRLSVAGIWYGTTNFELGELEPRNYHVNGNVKVKLQEAWHLGISVLAYLIPDSPRLDQLKAHRLKAATEIAAIARTPYTSIAPGNIDGSGLPFTLEKSPVSGGPVLASVAYHDRDCLDELAAFYAGMLNEASFFGGLYFDTEGLFFGNTDENPERPSRLRSPGGEGWLEGLRYLRSRIAELMDIPRPLKVIEWPGEFHLGDVDLACFASTGNLGAPIGVTTESTQVWSAVTLYGDRCRFSTFNDFGHGPNNELDGSFQIPNVIATHEVFAAIWAYYAMGGMVMPITQQWSLRPGEFFIPKVGEPEYSAWFTGREEFYRYVDRLFFKQHYWTRRFHSGQRLFESPTNSVVRRQVENALVAPGALLPVYTQAWYDPELDLVGIQATQWGMTAANGSQLNGATGAITEVWAETFTAADFPQLATARAVNLLNCDDGTITPLAAHAGGDYTVPNVNIDPSEVYWLILGDLP